MSVSLPNTILITASKHWFIFRSITLCTLQYASKFYQHHLESIHTIINKTSSRSDDIIDSSRHPPILSSTYKNWNYSSKLHICGHTEILLSEQSYLKFCEVEIQGLRNLTPCNYRDPKRPISLSVNMCFLNGVRWRGSALPTGTYRQMCGNVE